MLRADFAEWLEIVPSTAGIHLAARTAGDPEEVVRTARSRGAAPRSPATFSSSVHFGLATGFGAIPPERVDAGLALQAKSFRQS